MVGEIVLGRYALEELVGTGGMSSVYRAHDTLLERDVALKVMHDSQLHDEASVERFRREARAVAQLSHPNIVTVIDRGEEDGRQFIVFEYAAGENLKEHVTRRGPLPVRDALEIAIAVGRGLGFAHRQGIIHRDVKPQNVLMNGGMPKVTDFGIARSLDVEHGVTQTGTVIGTSDYIAPEQASGRPVGPETDVYSLGVVLFELLTGEVPFPGESFVAVAMRHIHDPPPSLLERRPDAPPRLARAVERAMAKDPADRFPAMDAFVAELEACAASAAGQDAERTMVAPGRAVRPPARRRRSPWPLVFLVAALVALGAVAAALLLGGADPAELVGGDEAESAPAEPVRLQGIASFDPDGDGQEHPERVADATDGDPSTYWTTERYRAPLAAIGKGGVGLVLDSGEPRSVSELTVTSSTPGFTAEIRAGGSPEGPFEVVGEAQAVGESTTFELADHEARYYVIWITELDRVARVNEVTAG